MNSPLIKSVCAVLAALVVSAPASAEVMSQPTTVVELFTSQGCSSCPPANNTVVELNDTQPDILALSYGVNYWDYLGWSDTFADPEFTQRQRLYDAVLNSGVYTPMLVVGGQTHTPSMTEQRLGRAPVPQKLAFIRDRGALCLDGSLPAGAKLALVEYQPGTQMVDVTSGENRGRTLALANVVKDVSYRDWTGDRVCGLHPASALAVLAHDAETSAIVGAARFEP